MSIDDAKEQSVQKAPHANCGACPLKDSRFAATSMPTRPLEAGFVAFVSRSPGKNDVRNGAPFTGMSGVVLDYLLNRYGVTRDQIITTNVVLCETDDPPLEAVKACRYRLEHEIKNADLVIAGGAEAVSALTRYRSVSRSRGFSISRTSPVSGKKQRVVVTNNPAAVIRDSDKFPDMVQDFRRAFNPPAPHKFPEVEIIDDRDRATSVLSQWINTEFPTPLASDLEWRGTEFVCAGFALKPEKAIVFGFGAVGDPTVRRLLKDFYERTDISFVWHNGKADTKILRRNDIQARIDEDTFLLSIALDERPGYHSLEYMLSNEFAWPDYEPPEVKEFKRKGYTWESYEAYHDLPAASKLKWKSLYRYNAYDAAGTIQLHQLLTQRLQDDN